MRGGGGDGAAGVRALTGRTLALTAAALVVPAVWGWLVARLLPRLWPRRPPCVPPRPPLPDYEI